MGLETGSFVSDLVTTNPVSSDARSQGDDHLRLIKTALQGSFPTASKAWYNPSYVAKTANYSVLAADMNKLISFDATSGALVPTLPALASGDAGWSCSIVKIDTSTNAVTVTPASGTINGDTTIPLTLQWQWTTLVWSGATWYAYRTMNPTFISTDPGAAVGPTLDLYRNSASPAASDILGSIDFNGKDSAANKQLYSRILSTITDPTSTSEDADIYLQSVIAGTLTTVLRSSGSQILIGGALGIVGALDVTGAATAASLVSAGAISGTTITGSGAISGASVTGTMVATQSDQETSTSTTTVVSPGRQQFHPSAAKMWGSATVSTGTGIPTLQTTTGNYNITSITDTALGRLTVTIATDFADTKWCCLTSVGLGGGNQLISADFNSHVSFATLAAGSVELSAASTSNAHGDPDAWYWMGFGDQ